VKQRFQIALVVVVSLILVPCAVLVWRSYKLPLQPAVVARARVTAIAPSEHRFHPNEEHIVVRNAHATGQFTMTDSDAKCDVGDEVVVEQRGTTLTRLPATCR
jgi:hypothetical protein